MKQTSKNTVVREGSIFPALGESPVLLQTLESKFNIIYLAGKIVEPVGKNYNMGPEW